MSTSSNMYSSDDDEIIDGLTSSPKWLSPKHFYDEKGSKLFDEICRLPEYYLTRTEVGLLKESVGNLISRYKPIAFFEAGSGAADKSKIIIDAMRSEGTLEAVGLLDLNPEFLGLSIRSLRSAYPEILVEGVVGDFMQQFEVPFKGISPKLVAFLGSTIGNLDEKDAAAFLIRLRNDMTTEDLFLLGTDLVKDPEIISAAYNDSQGVTAEFNLNILRVINDKLDADFDVGNFNHRAVYNSSLEQMEMYLDSIVDQTVHLKKVPLRVHLRKGESILTEISRKYRREGVVELMETAGFELVEWLTDPDDMFAVSLSKLVD